LPPGVKRRWTLGRAAHNDYVINHTSVSNRHAELYELDSGVFRLVDLGSTNGTFIGKNGQRVTQVDLQGDEVIFLSPHFPVPFIVLRQQLLSGSTGIAGRQVDLAKDLVRIGRAPDNDVCLSPLTVSRYHAEIRRLADGSLFIRDLGTKLGTIVNGSLIKAKEVPILPDASIHIGGCRISLDFTDHVAHQAKVAVDHTGFSLRVSNLTYCPPSDKTRKLIDDVSMVIYPGELVALMGPSGCGKSTLLNILIGELAPFTGSVDYDHQDLGDAPGMILPYVAHVPQDDFLNPDLTVRETLHCYARLRLPSDLSTEEIDAKIDDVCRMLGLYDVAKGIDLRDRLIGSSERKGLSGGQKKRVSMAMELLSDPRILFLDEPTSGLSSYDTRVVVEHLRKLSSTSGVAIIVTIHQPSLQVFRIFDSVLYLKSGKLVYYGPSFPESVKFFCPQVEPESSGPDGVMEVLDGADPELLSRSFAATQIADRFIWKRLKGSEAGERRGTLQKKRNIASLLVQGRAVFTRDWMSKTRDFGALALLASQPLLIGILLGQLFHDPGSEETVKVAFLVPLVCFWFGLNTSVRELVCERTLFRRERRGGLLPTAYLGSKFLLLGGIAFAQVMVLLLLLRLQLPELSWHLGTSLGLGLLTALTGIACGLAVSSFAASQLGAVSFVPLLLIPIILLSGFVVSYKSLAGIAVSKVLSDLMPVRWGFEGFSSIFEAVNPCFEGSRPVLDVVFVLLGFISAFISVVFVRLRRP